MNKAPCEKCINRYPCCHDTCENYQAWKTRLVRAKEAERMRRLGSNHGVLANGRDIYNRAKRGYYKCGSKLWGSY